MKFPNNIKALRLKKGLDQADIYPHVGLSQEQFSLLENGKRRLIYAVAKGIGDVLGVSSGEVAGDEEPPDAGAKLAAAQMIRRGHDLPLVYGS